MHDWPPSPQRSATSKTASPKMAPPPASGKPRPQNSQGPITIVVVEHVNLRWWPFWGRLFFASELLASKAPVAAPLHRAKATRDFFLNIVSDFLSAEEWAPNSPNLNSSNYSVWCILQELVYNNNGLFFAA